MKSYVLWGLLLLLFVNVGGAHAAESRPRFTWNTFQFFWNKQAVPGAEIRIVERRGEDYVALFGSSTSLIVRMEKDIVSEVEAQFVYTGASDVSGRAFLRLQDSMIRVGTYRWPKPMREEVAELFRNMTPLPRDYQARTSRFERRFNETGIWTMTLRFINEE